MTIDYAKPDADIERRYEQERNSRIRLDAGKQFIDLNETQDFAYLNNDTWADHDALNKLKPAIRNGDSHEILILGAGYGGLLFAARLIQAGIPAADIRLIDTAGGFGGTWYWNRYPGLMCDVESYIYMPLLEETGYMPKHKYAYGPELFEHANRIAAHFNLTDKGLFRSRVTAMAWDEDAKNWIVDIDEHRGPHEAVQHLRVTSRFTILAGGVLNVPHIPKIPGTENLKIPHFHSARWNYDLTGGTPANQKLEKLKDKRVGVIGTGPTAIQIVPELAKWSKHVVVFQRTPTCCDTRGQRETSLEEWAKISAEKGWQKKRAENFNCFIRGEPAETDLVQDGWCEMPTFSALVGSNRKGVVTSDGVEAHVAELNSMDFPRAQRLRARVDSVIKNKETAEELKSWYPTYCKRPTFHDEYLQSFNRRNVELVSTSGYGVERATDSGVVVNDVEYPVDVLVFSTGFRISVTKVTTPATNCDIKVTGRNGVDLNEKWGKKGPATLFGSSTNGFPNLFFATNLQCAASSNLTYILDNHAVQVAYCITAAHKVASTNTFTVEPTVEAEERWANETASLAYWFSALPSCTPGYFNGYSEQITDPEEASKLARTAAWGKGSQDFVERVQKWRDSGDLSDLVISS